MARPSEPDGFPIPNASAVLEPIGGLVDFEVITPFDRYNSALSVGAFCVIANKPPGRSRCSGGACASGRPSTRTGSPAT